MSDLSVGRYRIGTANNSNYAIFAGGYQYSTEYFRGEVDAYNRSLSRTTAGGISSRGFLTISGAHVGNYALIGPGYNNSKGGYIRNYTDAYNDSLTKSYPTTISQNRETFAASVGDYALFGGGTVWNYSTSKSNVVDTYDSSLTTNLATPLSQATSSISPANNDDYALFGTKQIIDVYDSSLIRTTTTGLSYSGDNVKGGHIGEYILFAGGYSSSYSNNVDVYDKYLVKSTPLTLSVSYTVSGSANIKSYYLIFHISGYNLANAFDASLTRSQFEFTQGGGPSGISIGNYALFGGGYNNGELKTVTALSASLA